MQNNKIDIKKVIADIWCEQPTICDDKLQKQHDELYQKLLKTLSEQQKLLFLQYINICDLLSIENEDHLIDFVLKFVCSIFKS